MIVVMPQHIGIVACSVVLGCTEIRLIMTDAHSPLPTLDSTRLLARAALRRAVGAVATHVDPTER